MAGGKVIKVLYEDNHLLVVEKPAGILVQADDTKDIDMLTELKAMLKEKYHKPGNVYLGLVHRLDRPVGGVMVFAKTSKAASRLSEEVRTNNMHKTYYAVVMGKVEASGSYNDKLLKDESTNISKVNPNGKESKLTYELIGYKDNMSLVKINLITGRSHQIRVQFSYHGHSLYGDQKYNKDAIPNTDLALYASELRFIHPITKEEMTFKLDLPNKYPFNIFK
jgi:23S rRNA pseudouridine1911/1915/1917 synthase